MTRLWGWCTLTLTALALSCSEPPTLSLTTGSETARERFHDGLDAFADRRMAEARAALEEAAGADPAFALAHAYHAVAMNYTGDVEASRRAALEHRGAASEEEQLAIDAVLAWSHSDYEAAKTAMASLLERLPGYAQGWFEMAWFEHRLGDHEAAAEAASRAVASEPGFVPAHLLRAEALLAAGRLDEATTSVTAALEIEPSSPRALSLGGDVAKRRGDLDEAVAAYDAALAADAGFVPASLGRADALRIAARHDEAIEAYRALCDASQELDDGSYKEHFLDWTKAEDLCFDYGMTHLLAGDAGEAASIFEATAHYTFETRMENAPIFYNSLGRLYLETGELDRAEEIYRRSLQVSRDAGVSPRMQKLWDGRFLLALARIEAKRGDFESAHRHASELEDMIDAAGEDGVMFLPAYHYMMGYILLEEERFEDAREHLEKSRLADPFNQWLLARARHGAGDTAGAREIAIELDRMPPGSYGHSLVVAEARAWLDAHGGATGAGATRGAAESEAERIVRGALRYANGSSSWAEKKTVSYVKTTTRFTPEGDVSETVVETHRYVLQPDLAVRIDREEDGRPVAVVNDGSRAWKIVDGKVASDESSRSQAQNQTFGSHYVFSIPHKLTDPGVLLTRAESRTLDDGTETDAVVVDYAEDAGPAGGQHSWTYFFAKDDGRLVAYHFASGPDFSQQSFARYLDHETVDGLRMPTKRVSHRYGDDGALLPKYNEIVYTDIVFDVELPTALFEER